MIPREGQLCLFLADLAVSVELSDIDSTLNILDIQQEENACCYLLSNESAAKASVKKANAEQELCDPHI